jgi:uncharacterized membrane protein YhdT
MSQSSRPLQPLSIGNVVSAALRLYRSHLQQYLQLSIFAHLWILVPIYGWAKYAKINAVVSRLAYPELIDQPESVDSAHRKLDPLMWSFWGIGFRVSLRVLGVYFLCAIVGGIATAILGAALGPVAAAIMLPILFIVIIVAIIRVYSRLVVAELPLAVEEGLNGAQSVDRSWQITQSAIGRIQGVVLVAGLVTLPLVGVLNYLPSILQLGMEPGSFIYNLFTLISLVTSLVGGALVMPFWQALKAVLYFDLRNRKEGLGLNLRDR